MAKKTGNEPTVSESSFVIPNGERLVIEAFAGGHEPSDFEIRTELVLRVGEVDTTIAVGYGGCFQYILEVEFTGNGSDAIVMRHVIVTGKLYF